MANLNLAHRRQILRLAAGSAALPLVSGDVWAQAYPTRPIRLVVPFPPGGAFDGLARPWADKIKPLLGTVIIEDIGGGGASIGAAAVARAPPDGYTLLFGGSLPHINEVLLKRRPLYNPNKDLDPIMRVAVGYLAIAVHPSMTAKSLKELVAYSKANPGKLSFGHAGIGSTNQLTGELFKSLAEIPDVVQIPYRGAGPVITDLISGQIPMGVVAVTAQSLEFHRSGKIRILAFTGSKPLIAAPELQTVAQAGFPGLTNAGSYGLLAPAGTPQTIIERIAQATRELLTSRQYQQMLIDIGFEATPNSTPEEFRQALATDVEHWAPIVKSLELKID